MGARFAKWRAVIAIGDGIPRRGCIEANAQALARYAAIVPGSRNGSRRRAGSAHGRRAYDLERCCEVTEEVLRTVFNQLYAQRVMLEGMILKPNMVLPGLTCPRQETVDEVADATVRCLLRAVPAAVPGIAFLSGGQSAELASARLNAMNVRFKSRLPWALAFSFARAIQQPALEIWQGKEANVLAAQQALYHRARCNTAARRGEYNAAMERIDRASAPRGGSSAQELREHPNGNRTCARNSSSVTGKCIPLPPRPDGWPRRSWMAWALRTAYPSPSVRLSPIWPLSGRFSRAAASRSGRRTSIPKRKAHSPARSARRCSSISAASTSSSDTASAGTNWANPIRSSTKRYGLPWPPAST